MNCASAGDAGGKLPFVVAGRVRVALPGAPGWTMTGGFDSACGAHGARERALASVVVENALASEMADTSMPADAATLNRTQIPKLDLLYKLDLRYRGPACRKYLTMVGLTISHPGGNFTFAWSQILTGLCAGLLPRTVAMTTPYPSPNRARIGRLIGRLISDPSLAELASRRRLPGV
jgi:hypothetical protein